MPKKGWSHKEFSRKGGLNRAKNLSEEERKRIASLGGQAARGKPRKKRRKVFQKEEGTK